MLSTLLAVVLLAAAGSVARADGWNEVRPGDERLRASIERSLPPGTEAPEGLVQAVGSIFTEAGQITGSDTEAGDRFGISVSMSGDRALIGSWLDDTEAGENTGSAYIFQYDALQGTWVEQAKLIASDATQASLSQQFGFAVELRGDVALIGARGADTQSDIEAGAAYLFVYDEGQDVWTEEAKLAADDGAENDEFGYSVALLDGRALVGSRRDETGAGLEAGSVYVFERDDATGVWSQTQKLEASDATAESGFGFSIAAVEERALIGAWTHDTSGGASAGAVYIFGYDANTGFWTEEDKLVASDTDEDDRFGYSVAFDGSRALVGAARADNAAALSSGAVYAFSYDEASGAWTEEQRFAASNPELSAQFGLDVLLDGDLALVGAPRRDGAETDQGAVYVFEYDPLSGLWSETEQLSASDGTMSAWFGFSLALSGPRALFGAVFANTAAGNSSGSVYVFNIEGGAGQAAWVNEIHYDNEGTDEGEAVEVVLPSTANTSDFDLSLYNANTGAVYNSVNLSDFTEGESEGGFTVYSLPIEGVQNGAPDGLALSQNEVLIPGQFLSYEGTFMATDGPAAGETSTDIGVSEDSDTPIGFSLQLTGTGTQYDDFTWTGPADDSFGMFNDGQTVGPPSGTPVVTFTEAGTTATEGTAVTLTVRLDFPNDMPDGNPITVTVAFDEDASTASEPDFDGPDPVQVMFDGTTDEAEQSVTVNLIGGDGNEGDETAVFELIVAGGIADLGTPSTFTLTIEDSEAPDPARVQVIHNAADPLAEIVDISIVDLGPGGDGATFDDVPFRGATPFFDLDPGTYQVTVTDEKNLAIVLIDETVAIASGETYQLIANGVVDPDDFEPNPSGESIAATIFVNDMAQEISTIPGFVQINGVHGVTDAPAIDVREVSTGTAIVDDVIYGTFGEYISVPPGMYTIEITSADGSTVFSTVFADVSELGGQAATLLASGFLTPANDQNGPVAGALAVLPDGTSYLLPYVVDIAEARALPNGSPVQIEGTVSRALGDFTRLQDKTAGLTIRQIEGAFHDAVADGTIEPGTRLRITGTTSEFRQLKQINEGDLERFEVIGSTVVPLAQTVTLEEIALNGEAYESEMIRVVNLLIDGEGDFAAATTYGVTDPTLDDGSVSLRTPNAGDTEIDGEPIPDGLAMFMGVLGQFSTDDPEAGYQLVPVQANDILAQEQAFATLQIIHNAPDPALAEVDVYIGGVLALDDFAFRTATEFVEAPAGIEIDVAVAPGDSGGPEDAFFAETYVLGEGLNYQLIALGVGEGDFEPNPDGEDIAFTLLAFDGAQLASDTDDTISDFSFVHGTPDAPTLEVRKDGGEVLYDDVAFGEIAGYQPIEPDATLLVNRADGSETLGVFNVDFNDRIDEAGTILASGFFTPENEPGDAPSFGLLIAFADGSTEFLPPFILPNTEGAVIPATFALGGNFPNPFAGQTKISVDLPADALVRVEVFDVLGRRVAEIAPHLVAAGTGRTVTLDAALPAGSYLYRLAAEMPSGTETATGRMTVVR